MFWWEVFRCVHCTFHFLTWNSRDTSRMHTTRYTDHIFELSWLQLFIGMAHTCVHRRGKGIFCALHFAIWDLLDRTIFMRKPSWRAGVTIPKKKKRKEPVSAQNQCVFIPIFWGGNNFSCMRRKHLMKVRSGNVLLDEDNGEQYGRSKWKREEHGGGEFLCVDFSLVPFLPFDSYCINCMKL